MKYTKQELQGMLEIITSHIVNTDLGKLVMKIEEDLKDLDEEESKKAEVKEDKAEVNKTKK